MDVSPDSNGLGSIGHLKQVIGALSAIMLEALGAAVLAGAGVTWMNWLIDLGRQL